MTEREEFEAWYADYFKSRGRLPLREEVWQAARASQPVSQPAAPQGSMPTDAELVSPQEDPMFGVILHALQNHTLTYTCTDDDERFPLVDKLVPPKSKDIALGNEELELIAETVWFAVADLIGKK